MLRDIESKPCSIEFTERNFALSAYKEDAVYSKERPRISIIKAIGKYYKANKTPKQENITHRQRSRRNCDGRNKLGELKIQPSKHRSHIRVRKLKGLHLINTSVRL